MADNLKRKCFKCGLSPSPDDLNFKLHRFPKPGSTNMRRCEMWAKFCFPDERWSSVEFQRKLYSEHRMLCNNHFKDSEFSNIRKKKLSKLAVPDMSDFDKETEAQPTKKLCNDITQVSEGNNSVVEIKVEYIEEKYPMPQSPTDSNSHQSFTQDPLRPAIDYEDFINETSRIKDKCNSLNSVVKEERTGEDECDLYCKLLAKKLRVLPEKDRVNFMSEIDSMFINRLRNLSNSSSNSDVSHHIPQQPTSSYSFQNELRIPKQPNSSHTPSSDSGIPNKIELNHLSDQYTNPLVLQNSLDGNPIGNSQKPVSSNSHSDPIGNTLKQQNTGGMPRLRSRPSILAGRRRRSARTDSSVKVTMLTS